MIKHPKIGMKVFIIKNGRLHQGRLDSRDRDNADRRKLTYTVCVYYHMTRIVHYSCLRREDLIPYNPLDVTLGLVEGKLD